MISLAASFAPEGGDANPDGLGLESFGISLFDGLDELTVTGLGLVAFVVFGFALFALLGALRRLLAVIPMSKARRSAAARLRPVFETTATLVYLLLAVPLVFKAQSAVVLTVLFFGMFGVLWFPIRDFVNGMLIRAGQQCEVGDRVTVEDRVGVVRRLGYRTLTLECDDGTEAFVPYARLSRGSIVRTPQVEGIYRYGFDVGLPAGDPLVAITLIKRLAMHSHWSSVVRDPEIETLADGGLRVNVFALGPEHGPAIEAAVRRGLHDAA
ncbi:mechanosensitive ion channel domain-containing protein [Enhygromyxa salina]|uniref:Mechanosensitive ion channel n=1 Tax=Enhygromyxa salina TaxID=215803 RepID=A0A2S9YWH3_9BACT|nr:mechanosensitive ion channel domain-containing protein [Enhygromyxa salina]PRQ09446.1 Mechanosensitive ion channel [Enhygromyxa salina]